MTASKYCRSYVHFRGMKSFLRLPSGHVTNMFFIEVKKLCFKFILFMLWVKIRQWSDLNTVVQRVEEHTGNQLAINPADVPYYFSPLFYYRTASVGFWKPSTKLKSILCKIMFFKLDREPLFPSHREMVNINTVQCTSPLITVHTFHWGLTKFGESLQINILTRSRYNWLFRGGFWYSGTLFKGENTSKGRSACWKPLIIHIQQLVWIHTASVLISGSMTPLNGHIMSFSHSVIP